MAEEKDDKRIRTAERDVIALGIATAAILLFVATGGAVLPDTIRSMTSNTPGPDRTLVVALLLNIALVIFGWRRYRELTGEIALRREAEAQAKRLSEVDPLTNCLNRRSMGIAAEELRAEAAANGRAIAFLMIDVDNFKQINDMHGHAVGDAVLQELSQRIIKQLPQQAQLARLGGDEFGVVLPFDREASERIDDLVIRLYEEMSLPFDLDALTVDVSLSIGVACADTDGDDATAPADADALMHRADIAMYHAKKQGKNRFFWFEPTMENELRFRNELETGIRRGIENDQFVPFYEQQIDLNTGELAGFEMLARWQSPQLGLVSPEIFIPIAEEVGVINEISDKLMAQAFSDASEWDERISLSINISPVQLRDPWFAQKLLKMLVEQGLPPRRLEIEITESCLHDNVGMVRTMITSLRNQGVKVSLDDFGTGYSSLEQLRTLPFDRLKIDRSFISELSNTDERSTIVDSIVSLGRGLNMPITAEGIEDEQTLELLKSMGPLKGQGYLYGRPETAEQVRERLSAVGLLAASKPDIDGEESTLIGREEQFERARAAR